MLLLAACVVGSSPGCSKKKQEDGKAEAEKLKAEADKKPVGDRYKDGQRLASALKDWSKRWSDTNDLPACDPLLKNAADQELCKTAAAALTTLKAAVAKPEPEATQIHLAAELAFATEAASEKLREASMEKLQAEHKAAPGPSASAAKLSPAAASAFARVRPSGSSNKPSALGSSAKPIEAAPVDPGMQVMQAYSRVNRAALRYLSQFLQFGPLPTRNAAFTELEGLSKRKESWPALGRTLREAAMAENDPDLQGKLKALAPKMSRRSGVKAAAPGINPTMPPGHPPAEQAEPAAAPAKE